MENKNNCLVCGQELIYGAKAQKAKCHYCQQTYATNALCAAGHYICDSCHTASARELITTYCLGNSSLDPISMALNIMAHPSMHMHGPEHHYLVPAVLLTTAYQQTKEHCHTLPQILQEAQKRAQHVLGGFCGFYGACGAAVGTGIFASLWLKATPISQKEWSQANLITSQVLHQIALHGGPRCCKRNTFLALQKAMTFAQDQWNLHLGKPQSIHCSHFPYNKECRGKHCPFFPVSG